MRVTGRARGVAAVAAVAVFVGVGATACGTGERSSFFERDGRLKIATTVAPITSIVASVVGDRADVRGLIPEGADSHTFEPPPSAAKVLAKADLVFVNGLKLEDPTKDLAQENRKKGAEVVELALGPTRPTSTSMTSPSPRTAANPN